MTRRTIPDQIFVDLVDTYLDRVYRYLCNLTRNGDTARDLCHETFLLLRKQVDRGSKIGEGYVFTTARNTALSSWRSDKREESKRLAWGLQPHTHASASASVENNELLQAIQTALGILSEEHR